MVILCRGYDEKQKKTFQFCFVYGLQICSIKIIYSKTNVLSIYKFGGNDWEKKEIKYWDCWDLDYYV